MAKGKKSRLTNPAPMPMDNWQAEEDLRTLMRAEQIEADPKRLKAAQALARKQLAATRAVLKETGKDES